MRYRNTLLLAVALLLGVSAAGAYQQEDKKTGNKPAKNAKEQSKNAKDQAKAPPTAEQEAEALRFVREHHPQLADLLSQLKSSNTAQYQQAIRDLHRAATTLGETQKNDPKKYELDLKAWEVSSKIQVLAARYIMTPSPELENEIKAKLLEQIDIKLEQQKFDRERTAKRLERLDAVIAKTQESRQQEADKALEKLTRSTVAKPARKKSEPAATSTSPKEGSKDKPSAKSK